MHDIDDTLIAERLELAALTRRYYHVEELDRSEALADLCASAWRAAAEQEA